MEVLKNPSGAFTPSLLLGAALMVISLILITQMKDPVYTDK
jgi:hypothetical protein